MQNLLSVNLVSLVQDDPDLVIVATQRHDHAFELITDVQLVRVEQQQNEVALGRKPLRHPREIVASLRPLLLSG